MELNLEVCRAIAVQHGLPLQFVVKEFHVFEVLGQLTAATSFSKKLVFKGGTALNKVFLGKAQRFSEDLDFDLPVDGLPELRVFCSQLAREISGYEISELRRVGDTIQFYCGFQTPLGSRDHVRVDVAAKKIISSKPLEVRPAVSEYSQRSVTGFRVYSIEDLSARKLHALCTRAEGKDFFDAFHALPLCGGMDKAVQKMLDSEGSFQTPAEFLEKTVGNVRKADPSKLRNLTNPFIPTPYRPKDWLELKNDLALKLERMREELK